VQKEQLIPILIERSTWMIVSILGILKSGGAYVPIDPEYPLERIKFILEDTAATIIVSSSASKSKLNSLDGVSIIEADSKESFDRTTESVFNLENKISPQQLAYVIYTSGSTGLPKGVLIEHRSVVNLIHTQSVFFKIDSEEKILQFSNYSFDASVEQIFLALLNGASLVLLPAELQYDTVGFENYLRAQKVTHLHATPFFLENIQSDSYPDLKRVIAGGDVCRKELSAKWKDKVDFYNEYGPTETTVTAVEYHDKGEHNEFSVTPIGKAISNVTLYILDQYGALCPQGIPGELYIGGVQVARGYLNKAELTAERFITNPVVEKQDERVYRTGDLVRQLRDGILEYLGRIDDQVKIHGYRIELGEIESVIHESGLVKQAVVAVKEDAHKNKHLAAYVLPQEGYDQQLLKTQLESKLPAFMVPPYWVELDSFPLTSNGKIDKKALPDPGLNENLGKIYVAPRNETEEQLASIWQNLLGVDQPSVNDNFFKLGGHSLLAMRLIAAIRKQLDLDLAIRDLFQYPTIAALSAYSRSKHPTLNLPVIEIEERPEKVPLSFAQERLWFIDQLEGSSQYHIYAVLNLKGELDQKALTQTLQSIVNRHEVLRTVIREVEGQAHQLVLKKNQWQLNVSDAPAFKGNIDVLNNSISKLISTPFNLAEDHMLRAELIKLDHDEFILVAIMHHIASDGWSTSILVKEVIEFYSAYVKEIESNVDTLPIQYADYAIWQRKNLQGDLWETKVNYWKQKLQATPPLQLTTDFLRPTVKSTDGAVANLNIDEELSNQLKELGNAQGATLFITLLTAFKVLLFKYTGQEDICIGTPISGRTQHEVESLIGNFVNTLALRSSVSVNNTFIEQLQSIWDTTLEAYEYQDIPFEKVVEAVVKERSSAISPLFQIMFVLQNTPEVPKFSLENIHLTSHSFQQTRALFDLTLYITETGQGLQASITYSTDLFKPATMNLMLKHYETLLRSIVSNPKSTVGMLDILSKPEILELEKLSLQSGEIDKEWESIVALFQSQAESTPSEIALVFNDVEISYEVLNERSNYLAHYLVSRGVQSEQLIPVCMERGIDLIVSILGILKAGAAYVPIDINYPIERIQYMIDDTRANLVLVSHLNAFKLVSIANISIVEVDGINDFEITSQPGTNPNISIASSQLAYIIYTSGSTGKPKGVEVQHNNVVSLVKEINYVELSSNDRLLVTGSPSFDATTFEYWSMLLNGGRLIMCKESDLLDISYLQKAIKIHEVTIMWFTSSWFNQLIDTDISVFEGLKTIIVGGEKLSESHVAKFLETHPEIELINGYGPTENTTFSLTHHINSLKPDAPIPVGRPLSNRSVYVLDKAQKLVPIGVGGEIYLGGAGLSRGYLNKPDLTAEKFISNPFNSNKISRLYRTGDLGRWLPDGTVEYIGRIDEQLKIRGYRIEPGEIESVIYESGMARQAVVLGRVDHSGVKRLVAYIILEDGYSKEGVQAHMSLRLPEYMIPSVLIEVDAIPLTINGKTDIQALPLPEISNPASGGFKAPTTELEMSLAKIWQEILEVERVGIDDDFFQLGGHSILAIRLVSSIRKELNFEIVIRDVFDCPTIALLAQQLAKQSDGSNKQANLKSLIQIKDGSNKIPLYIVSGGGGTVFKFKNFADMLDRNQPVYGIQQPTTAEDLQDFPNTIEGIAAKYNEEILQQNPEGPYALSGHCLGGTIAFEMTKQLEQMGKKVVLLALFDTQTIQRKKRDPGNFRNLFHIPLIIKRVVSSALLKLNFELFLLRKHPRQAILYKVKKLKLVMRTTQLAPEEEDLSIFDKLAHAFQEASQNYEMKPYNGDLLVFYAKQHYYFMDRVNKVVYKEINYSPAIKHAWNKYAKSATFYEVEGEHSTIFDPLYATEFSKILQDHINRAVNESG
jgi:amino acid adenylation domain-containing protein